VCVCVCFFSLKLKPSKLQSILLAWIVLFPKRLKMARSTCAHLWLAIGNDIPCAKRLMDYPVFSDVLTRYADNKVASLWTLYLV
jgi:hypothetical protein